MADMKSIGIGYVILSNSKEPKYTEVECVCLDKTSAIKANNRVELESGHNAVPSLYKLPFYDEVNCDRHRQHDSYTDDGERICYVVSEVVGDSIIPTFIHAKYELAEEKAKEKELDYQIDLVHIKEA